MHCIIKMNLVEVLQDRLIRDESIFNEKTVVWVFGAPGGVGDPQDNSILFIDNIDTSREFSTCVRNGLNDGWTGDTIVYDITRNINHNLIYKRIRECKSERIVTSKRNGRITNYQLRSSKILVFAGFPPDVDRMGMDRWKIYEVVNGALKYRDPWMYTVATA